MLLSVTILAWCIYVFILYIFIIKFDCPTWEYLGHECHISNPNWAYLVILLLLMVPILALQYQRRRDIFLSLWLTFSIALFISPNVALYLAGSGGAYFPITLLNMLCLVLLPSFIPPSVIRFPLVKYPNIVYKIVSPMLLLFLPLALTSVLIAYTNGFFSIASLYNDVYVQRLTAREYQGSIINYLSLITNNVVFPLAFYYSWLARNIYLLIIAITGILFVFSYASFRSFFVPSSVLFLFYLSNLLSLKFSNGLTRVRVLGFTFIAVVSLIAICTIFASSSSFSLITGSILTRTVVTPAIDNAKYIQYFAAHPHFMLRDVNLIGPIAQWFTDGYAQGTIQDSKGFTLGSYYFTNTTNLNAPLWSSGFADFGFFGYLLYPSLVFWLYRLIEGRILLLNMPGALWFIYPYSLIIIFSLNEASINGIMIGYCLLPLLMLVYLLAPKSTDKPGAYFS